jgi:uracil-DNA glycosylase family 4
VKCVPPKNKPLLSEIINCSQYLDAELELLHNLKCILAFGSIAFSAYLSYIKRKGVLTKSVTFFHGAKYEFEGFPTLYASYHPSPQNTYTKKLTEPMLTSLLKKISQTQ